ncbi:hypothetical protein N7457_006222 [Penicillium paradoxum]|uniref:uncharacterized protein n=1 Tax=Penicillium paradoxum TaxID=176176 RepID=UPI00254659F0|nr:uncharacterized protein N7457_006222 [Penicillium paradoxum]KAJ5781062.1 hypothetical protein N7457_006222 [Penicillium paradoxum]
MASDIPSSNGGDGCHPPSDAEECDLKKEKEKRCGTCSSLSHMEQNCPFRCSLNPRQGLMTFHRREFPVEELPLLGGGFPRFGDPPVYRPRVPDAPRALRNAGNYHPLLVPPHLTSLITTLSQRSTPHVAASDSRRSVYLTVPVEDTKDPRTLQEKIPSIIHYYEIVKDKTPVEYSKPILDATDFSNKTANTARRTKSKEKKKKHKPSNSDESNNNKSKLKEAPLHTAIYSLLGQTTH